jgi:DNA replication and repair protein RecF
LRQRNKILLDAKLTRRDCSEIIEPWDQSLIESGSSLMQRRWFFVQEFLPSVIKTYSAIAGPGEVPGMKYVPSVQLTAPEKIDSIRGNFEDELRTHEDEERRTGASVVGPHRDELDLQVDELSLRKFASQGQHKTYLVALKLAEFSTFGKRSGKPPCCCWTMFLASWTGTVRSIL